MSVRNGIACLKYISHKKENKLSIENLNFPVDSIEFLEISSDVVESLKTYSRPKIQWQDDEKGLFWKSRQFFELQQVLCEKLHFSSRKIDFSLSLWKFQKPNGNSKNLFLIANAFPTRWKRSEMIISLPPRVRGGFLSRMITFSVIFRFSIELAENLEVRRKM